MEEWKEYRLGDFMEFNPKIKLAKNTLAKKISMDQLIPNCRYINNWTCEPYSGGAKFENGDTIMARITPCLENGKHAYISCLGKNEVAYGSTEYIVIRGRSGISDNLFVYYLSHLPAFKNAAIKSMVGTSGRQRAQVDVLKNIKIKLPTISEQKSIASFLSSLDDKIEINKRINDNLEQQAQALFKYWFVDFEPFKNSDFVKSEIGLIPKGFMIKSLIVIANYLNGIAMQNFRPTNNDFGLPVMKIKELGMGKCDYTSDKCSSSIDKKYIINNGDVIFSWSGTLLVDLWCGGLCGLNQHLYKVTSKDYPKWFYYMWTKEHLNNFIQIAKDKAVTMGHIKRCHLEEAKVIVPTDHVMNHLTLEFQPIIDEMICRKVQSHHLAQLRDTLLPRLMSGELKV